MKKVRAIFLFFYFCMFKLQFSSARSCNTTAYCGCMVQRRQDNMRAWHITRMSPMNQPSTAWGGTERKVKVVSTLSYHTNISCWWWATASTPQGWSQSITAGSDLHQPLEAVLGFAVPWATHKGQPGLCCSVFNSPSSARRSVYHWICGTLSRSCLLLLLSLIAVQSLTRKTPFFCCTWGTSYCGGLTLAGHQVSYQSCPIPLLLSWAGQRKSNKSLLTVNLRTRRDHSPVILSWVKQTWGKFMYFIANQIRVE